MPHYFYLARCRDQSLYAGTCIDILDREATHNSGKGAKYTRSKRPVRIVYFKQFATLSAARKREAQVKQWQREKKEALITASRQVEELEDIPNVGPRIARDFRLLGIKRPEDLCQKDPLLLYTTLCHKTKTHQDPCVLDTFMSAIDFMNGNPARPWWTYTEQRKAMLKASKE